MRRRVCITGIGMVSALGGTREATWRGVLAGESGAGPITAFNARTWPTNFACEVKNFELAEVAVGSEMRRYLSRAGQFGVTAAYEAMIESGLAGTVAPHRMGICLGANIGALSPVQLNLLLKQSGVAPQEIPSAASPEILRNHPGTLAAVLSTRWQCLGPISTIQTACASSGQALGQAYLQIRHGLCDAVLAGGADSLQAELLLAGFCLLGALSRRNDNPRGASRPFDRERDGFVAGEGAAMLVLEEREHALQRGAPIYGELCGYGETESAYRITDLPPDGRGIVEAMNEALNDAEMNHEKIDYINAHGTSTELNDRIEALAVRRVFGERGIFPRISSTKSETGHLISAAGALELGFCALAVRDGLIPPTRNLSSTDCGSDLDFVKGEARAGAVRAAMSNSIGFGGSNSSLIVKRMEA